MSLFSVCDAYMSAWAAQYDPSMPLLLLLCCLYGAQRACSSAAPGRNEQWALFPGLASSVCNRLFPSTVSLNSPLSIPYLWCLQYKLKYPYNPTKYRKRYILGVFSLLDLHFSLLGHKLWLGFVFHKLGTPY